MAKNVYVINLGGANEEVTSLKAVADTLGVSRVTVKDIESGKYPEVSIQYDQQELILEDDVQEVEPTVEELTNIEEGTDDEDTVELTNKEEVEETTPTEEEPIEAVEEDIEYPEVGDFNDEKAMKKYIKKLSNSALQEWCEIEGAEWKPNDHDSINRMRMAMAIKAIHFPELAKPKATKKKSKYADYSTEELVQMALDNDVAIKDAKGDARIERMYTIMALREAGLLA